MTLEDALYTVLAAAIAAAPRGHALHGAKVQPTLYDRITDEYACGIRIGDAESDLISGEADECCQEQDIVVPLQIWVRVGETP